MTAAELNLVIKAKDQSAKTFTAMKSHFNRLKANAKKVGQAMNRALGAGLRKTMDLTKKVMIGMAIAIAAVAAAVVKLRNGAKTYILQIDKMTKVTGMSTEEFTKFAYAAEQEHASLETIAKVLPVLSKYMAYAQQGMETYKREFDKMGIKVVDAKGKLKSTYQVLLEMSDFMGKKGSNDTEKLAILMTLLGRRGAEIKPLLMMGSKWFKKMGKEAEYLGIVLDEKTTKAIKKADDSLTMLKKAFLGVGIAIIKAIEPNIERAQDALLKYVINARKWIDAHREDIIKKLSDAWVKVEQVMRNVWGFMKKMMDAKWRADQFEKIKDAFQKMVPFIKALAWGMATIAVATNVWLIKLLAIKGLLETSSKIQNFLRLQQAEYLNKLSGEARELAKTVAEQRKQATTLEERNKLTEQYNKLTKSAEENARKAAELAQKVIEKGRPAVSVLEMAKDPTKEIREGMEKLKEIAGFALEPIKQHFNKEKGINTLLEERKKIYDILQKARTKIPAETGRVKMLGKETVFTKEKPAGMPAEQFDKTVAEAKAQNQALDSLKTATEGMLGDLIQNYKDGKIGIDGLASGIASYAAKANSLSNAQTSVLSQVISVVKSLTSKTNALAKTVSRQALSIKQLAGQGAG